MKKVTFTIKKVHQRGTLSVKMVNRRGLKRKGWTLEYPGGTSVGQDPEKLGLKFSNLSFVIRANLLLNP